MAQFYTDNFLYYFMREMEQRTYLSVGIRGKHLQVKIMPNRVTTPPVAKRGKVTAFSKKARLRLLKCIAEINWQQTNDGVFVQMGYPDCISLRSPAQRKKDKYQFIRYIEKYLRRPIYGIWRLEWEQRKSGANKGRQRPHWHMLIPGVQYIPKEDINNFWQRSIKWNGFVHTYIERMNEGEQASLYVAKYMSKVATSSDFSNVPYRNILGRHYGYMRKKMIPMCPFEGATNLSKEQIIALLDVASEKFPRWRWDDPTSFSLLGKLARETWERIIEMSVDRYGECL